MRKFIVFALINMGLLQPVFSQSNYDVFNPCPDNMMTADGKWKLHDMNRPKPPRVAPDVKVEKELAQAPANAIHLLGKGSDDSLWKDSRTWIMQDGVMAIYPKTRNLETKDSYGSCRLHLEWMAPADSKRDGQNRANSGVFLMSTYEVQVLDTYENETYADGMAGAVYGVKPPDANSLRPSGEWQSYDIWFKRPTFDGKGQMVTPACVTIYINGVLVQNNTPYDGISVHQPRKPYIKHDDKLPLGLQYHNETISFRNAWIVPIDNDEVVSPAGKLGYTKGK